MDRRPGLIAILLTLAGCATDPPPAPHAPPPAVEPRAAQKEPPAVKPLAHDDGGGVAAAPSAEPKPVLTPARPAAWAQPLTLSGVPNLNRITDRLYRGGQPETEGFLALADLGVKTIINLRAFHSDRDEIGDLPLTYYHVSIPGWDVEDQHVIAFLKLLRQAPEGPVYFHCWHGADRTGVMCAAYRMVVQGWSREEAGREMREGGYGFHPLWQGMVDYVAAFDAAALAEKVGYPWPPETGRKD